MTKTAKIFKNGRSQAVRLPAEFRFAVREVYIRRDPDSGDVILSVQPRSTWADFLKLAEKLKAEAPEEFRDFMKDRPKSPPLIRDLF